MIARNDQNRVLWLGIVETYRYRGGRVFSGVDASEDGPLG
jgi:hypothetical protein